ncbi:MAG: hypothetical protein A3G41_04490 [Elusimicrobia bacterium RIFCSPLOWO2_12_FULL_59_9]|nr:MAG: hypothetical protein A3G41_04490 [Elusimicrobia bacterium RIFCSPLOWO2_12_FULL_59_9]
MGKFLHLLFAVNLMLAGLGRFAWASRPLEDPVTGERYFPASKTWSQKPIEEESEKSREGFDTPATPGYETSDWVSAGNVEKEAKGYSEQSRSRHWRQSLEEGKTQERSPDNAVPKPEKSRENSAIKGNKTCGFEKFMMAIIGIPLGILAGAYYGFKDTYELARGDHSVPGAGLAAIAGGLTGVFEGLFSMPQYAWNGSLDPKQLKHDL